MNYRLLLLPALAALAIAGCVRETEQAANAPAGSAPAAAKGSGERLQIAVVPKGTTHEFWQTVKAGADAAGKEVNAEILWNGPEKENNVPQQIDLLRNYAAQGVDGLAVAATDKSALVQPVQDLEAKGIPVVVIDSGIEKDVSRSFIATDNVAAARLAAQELGRLLGGKGKVAVLNFTKGSGTSDEREQGFLEGIKAFPGIQVVAKEYSNSDLGLAVDQTESILTQHPDLDGIFASNEPNVAGAAKVLENRKLAGKVKLVGFDASEAEIEYLKRGVVHALIVQDPFKMGYEGVKALAQVARGEGTPEKRIDTGAKVITRENMTTPEMEKLLYPLGKKG